MSPDQWLDKKFSGEFFSGKFEHLNELVQELKLNSLPGKTITVVGTNGKGETSRCLGSLVSKNKKSYALWTSPHLFSVNERFVFTDNPMEPVELTKLFVEMDSKLNEQKLSFFEFLFICFLTEAKRRQVDFVILEVGLGGRLDAVNTVDADLILLTSISRDHQEYLGNTYKKILFEKLGVTRKGVQLISNLELTYLRDLTSKFCKKNTIPFVDIYNGSQTYSERNRSLAINAAKFLNLECSPLNADSAKRLEQKYKCTQISYYSSHNPDGMRKLVQHLNQVKYNNFDYILLSLSERSLADLRTMVKVLALEFKDIPIFFFDFSFQKRLEEKKLEAIKEEFKFEVVNKEALFKKIDFQKSNHILCTGSQYFFQHIYQIFESR